MREVTGKEWHDRASDPHAVLSATVGSRRAEAGLVHCGGPRTTSTAALQGASHRHCGISK